MSKRKVSIAAVLDISLSVYGKYERGDRELPRHVQVRVMRQTDHDPFELDAPVPSLQALKDQAKQPIASMSLVRHIRAVLRSRKLIVADRIAYDQNVIPKWTSRRNEFFDGGLLVFNVLYQLSQCGDNVRFSDGWIHQEQWSHFPHFRHADVSDFAHTSLRFFSIRHMEKSQTH